MGTSGELAGVLRRGGIYFVLGLYFKVEGFHRMRSQQFEQRLSAREQQTRGWLAPVPDYSSVPRASGGVRVRQEWDTRDTMNNRLWNDTLTAGPKAVTAEMIAAHPSSGAETTMPAVSRQDTRVYTESPSFFPNANQGRPRLPPTSVFQNPALIGINVEGGDVVRELRSSVKEVSHGLVEDRSNRLLTRAFEHQWIPAAATNNMVDAKILAAEMLRPAQDDYRRDYTKGTST